MVALGHWSFLPGPTLGKVHSIWASTGGEVGLTPLLRISGEESEVQGREEVKARWDSSFYHTQLPLPASMSLCRECGA